MKQVLRNKDTGTPLQRYKKSFFHAVDGIIYATRNEHNMIIIILCGILAIVAGFTFKIDESEWLFIVLIIGLVSGTEMINTAIEAVVDLETIKIHPLAKIAKDTASSASLIFSIVALVGGLIIFIPKVIVLFS